VVSGVAVDLHGGFAKPQLADLVAHGPHVDGLAERELQLGAAREIDAVVQPGPDQRAEHDQQIDDQRGDDRDPPVLDEVVVGARLDQLDELHLHKGSLERCPARYGRPAGAATELRTRRPC
jgi:hypothetical protein